MEFNCNVKIVDAIMGAGKSQSIINHINSDNESKFLIITPYLDEIVRYKTCCPTKKFKSPNFANGTKLDDIKTLLSAGENIVSTHALFQKFDNELIDICRATNYTLIMDEVADVVEEYPLSRQDLDLLFTKYVDINYETKQLIWKDEYNNYKGKFDDEKRLCQLGSLVCYGNNLMVWLFPVEVFNSFRNIYILTYKFNLQLQRYYYDYYGLPYTFLSVAGDSLETYHLIEYQPDISYIQYDYSKLIHICDHNKLNLIGDRNTDLSKTWYMRNKNNGTMKVLKNNLSNFFCNIRNNCSSDNLWTTFKDFKQLLKGKGYTKGFLPLNARATNEYRNRTAVAYPVNRYLNPFVKNFFQDNGVAVDEDGYALTEMLQFIWRSAVRDGKEVWVYIPSVRMRNLLIQWIKNNPLINN